MKSLSFLFIIIFLSSCAPKKTYEKTEFSEDYVLIEFASKLEEDYHRMHNTPYSSQHAHPPLKDDQVGDEILIEEMHGQ